MILLSSRLTRNSQNHAKKLYKTHLRVFLLNSVTSVFFPRAKGMQATEMKPVFFMAHIVSWRPQGALFMTLYHKCSRQISKFIENEEANIFFPPSNTALGTTGRDEHPPRFQHLGTSPFISFATKRCPHHQTMNGWLDPNLATFGSMSCNRPL
jgi:hypothetical protein